MIRIGCAGFPVGKRLYVTTLKTVEAIQFFDRFPTQKTIEKWKNEIPDGFEFIVCAPKSITHLSTGSDRTGAHSMQHGYFQDSASVRHAYAKTYGALKTLQARHMFFKLPSALGPHAESVGRIQKFFNSVPREGVRFIWEAPKTWPASLVRDLSKSLHIVPAMNPLSQRPPDHAPMNYFRLGGGHRTQGVHSYSKSELKDIKAACNKPVSYVIFNNGPTSFRDALAFKELVG